MGPISYIILVEAYTYGCCKISHKIVLKFNPYITGIPDINGVDDTIKKVSNTYMNKSEMIKSWLAFQTFYIFSQ